jgi:hypothetical protein
MTDGLFTFGTLETVEIHRSGPAHANDPVALCPKGVLYRHQGNMYRYVQYVDLGNGNIYNPDTVYWYALDPVAGVFQVTPDANDSIADINGMAGVCHCPYPGVDDGNFTFIQVAGISEQYLGNDLAVPGDKVIGSVSTFEASYIALHAVNNDNIFGIVVGPADPTHDTNMVLLQNLAW